MCVIVVLMSSEWNTLAGNELETKLLLQVFAHESIQFWAHPAPSSCPGQTLISTDSKDQTLQESGAQRALDADM